MRDILPVIDRWRADGRRVALATVVHVWGSAPRPIGSKMAVADDGEMAGSVSGGCVEGAIVEEAREVLENGVPKLVSFGVSDDDAWAVGLSCGGQIDIWVERLEDGGENAAIYGELRRCLDEGELVALATDLAGGAQLLLWPDGRRRGTLGDPSLDRRAGELADEQWSSFGGRRDKVAGAAGELDLFVEIHAPPPRLVIVGAVHVTVALVHMANIVGFETIVVDPRTAFATEARFAHADRLLNDWPDEALEAIGINANTFVALLSHDLKLDLPALRVALPKARYVGALGSKKTHAKRLRALAEAGVDDALAARIHNPIGLDLGGRRAEEIAVAVLAEIVAVAHGRDARPVPA